MTTQFKTVGLMGKYNNPEIHSTLTSLIAFLEHKSITVLIDAEWGTLEPEHAVRQVPTTQLGQLCDLIIVVGGDGSLLNAARAMVDQDVPLVGVNRGQRGFLTDISPQVLTQSLEPILEGQYREEHRFLLEMELWRDDQRIASGMALNDVVLYSGHVAKMIEFEVRVDNQIVYRQRSDGLITATPTGSTAYALAGGGPILHPSLAAIVLVPMHPPMLSSRPIVIDSKANIELHLVPENTLVHRLSCDGQIHVDAQPDDRIHIRRKAKELRLLHPTDYDYYHTLRTKLKWSA
jgi:NAD+ kinase